jgi:hypothetical protein
VNLLPGAPGDASQIARAGRPTEHIENTLAPFNRAGVSIRRLDGFDLRAIVSSARSAGYAPKPTSTVTGTIGKDGWQAAVLELSGL